MKISFLRIMVLVFVLALSSMVVAVAAEELEITDAVHELSAEVGGKSLPSPLAKLAGNEKINIYIQMENGEEIVIGLVTSEGIIRNMAVAEVKDPTIKVYSSEEALRGIVSSEDKLGILLKAVKDKKIRYEGVGFKNKVKLLFASGVIRLAGLFQKDNSAKVEVLVKSDLDSSTEDKENNSESVDSDQNSVGDNEEVEEERDLEEDDSDDSDDNKVNGEDDDSNEDNDSEDDAREDSNDAVTGNVVATVKGSKVHIVNLIENGFNMDTLNIKAGESVEWKDIRSGRFKQGMIIGTRTCREIKSSIFNPGESFTWTFKEPGTCVIADGIYTTQTMKVVIG